MRPATLCTRSAATATIRSSVARCNSPRAAWITTVWPPENLQLLEHQWSIALDYWGELAAQAKRHGVRLAIEMHANQLIYNVPNLLRLREAVGDTVGANFDPSHLLRMGADPIAPIAALDGAIHHVHAKDHPHRETSCGHLSPGNAFL